MICLCRAKKRGIMGSGLMIPKIQNSAAPPDRVRHLLCIRRGGGVLLFLLILLEFQLSELPGEIDPEGPERDAPQAVQRKAGPGHGRRLVDIKVEGIGRGEGYARLFVPELFAHCEIVAGERRVATLDLVAGGPEIPEKF